MKFDKIKVFLIKIFDFGKSLLSQKLTNLIYKKDESGFVCKGCGREVGEDDGLCPECLSPHKSGLLLIGNERQINPLNIIAILLIILTPVIAVVEHGFQNSIFSTEAMYWLFSAVLQAFCGLLGFFAAVIVFRMQVNISDQSSFLDKARQALVYFHGERADFYTLDQVLVEGKKIIDANANNPGSTGIASVKKCVDKIKTIQKSNNSARRNLITSMNYNLTVIISALIFLVWTDFIQKQKIDLAIIIFLVGFCLISVYKIKNTLSFIH